MHLSLHLPACPSCPSHPAPAPTDLPFSLQFGERFEFACNDCVCLEGGSGIVCQAKECSQEGPTACTEEGTYLVTEVNPADTCCTLTSCSKTPGHGQSGQGLYGGAAGCGQSRQGCVPMGPPMSGVLGALGTWSGAMTQVPPSPVCLPPPQSAMPACVARSCPPAPWALSPRAAL